MSAFWNHVSPEPTSGCWLWVGSHNGKGYGQLGSGREKCYAHRLSYEMHKGPIPDDLELDHLCRTPSCCNPDHLEPVTGAENRRRAIRAPANVSAREARWVTHCKRGHPLSGENLAWEKRDGSRLRRVCRVCRSEKLRSAYRKRMADPETAQCTREAGKERLRVWCAANQERLREYKRQYYLRAKGTRP